VLSQKVDQIDLSPFYPGPKNCLFVFDVKNTNTIQPARLTETQNSEMKTELLKQVKEICQAHHPVLPPPNSLLQKLLNQKLKVFFSTRNRCEPLTITEPADTVFDTVMVSEDPDIAVRVKPPPRYL